MAKGKQQQRKRQQRKRKQQRREQRRERPAPRRESVPSVRRFPKLPAPQLDVERLELLAAPPPGPSLAPIALDAACRPMPDPLERLGLAPEEARDEERVRAAYRRELLAHPPELEPEHARELREALDRLTAPERAVERELGVIELPDPDAYGLPAAPSPPAVELTALQRLLGQVVLYTFLADELRAAGGAQGQLPLFR